MRWPRAQDTVSRLRHVGPSGEHHVRDLGQGQNQAAAAPALSRGDRGGRALGSERDEPDCFRFNVLQDEKDENVYYFYEVYKDQAALEAHRKMPHYAKWQAVADTLDGPTEPTRCKTVFPAAGSYWAKSRR